MAKKKDKLSDWGYFRYDVGHYLPGWFDKKSTFKPYREDKSKLVWMVIGQGGEYGVQPVNIFDYNWIFLLELVWAAQSYPRSFIKFADHVRHWLSHEYCGRCQYEILLIGSHDPKDKTHQIDIYDQVMLNWDRFIEYCWKNRKLLTIENLGLESVADRLPTRRPD